MNPRLSALQRTNPISPHQSHIPYIPITDAEGRSQIPREIYLVLEYCESDLSGIVRTCSLTPQHIRSYMYQILRGLAYIQRHGLLHRDLKSACVLSSLSLSHVTHRSLLISPLTTTPQPPTSW